MELLKDQIDVLKEQKLEEYWDENFNIPFDENRLYSYLNEVVLKYNDKEIFNTHLITLPRYKDDFVHGTIKSLNGLKTIVPELKTLRDEMMHIHEITHLINFLNNQSDMNSVHKNVIPVFNEYDYLKRIQEFYSDYYRKLVFNNAVIAARNINENNQNDYLSYIMAYLVLEHRKDNYNIDKLNKMNCESKKLEQKLITKGYTF